MNISFSETFKKVTSVALIFGLVFSTLTPAAFADTNGPSNPGTATDISGVGTKTWGTTSNITTEGSPYSNVSLNIGETSHYLQATNYGFNIPTGATINGITVQINREGSANTLGLGVRDSVVKLVKGGTVVGTNKAVTGTTWGTTFSTVTYGGTNDLWGTTWTPSDINSANFGAAFSVTTNALLARTATVDFIKITVHYTPDTTAPTIAQVTATPSPTADTTPNYTFTTNEAGAITYGGDCSSSTTAAVVGSNTITFNALSSGTHSNCTITVTDVSSNASNILAVNSFTVDTTGPVITLNGSTPVTVEVGSVYTDAGATALDTVDGDRTANIITVNPVNTNVLGTYTVTYNVVDTLGNAATQVTRTVNVVDTTKPVITLLGSPTVSVNFNASYSDAGATASDNVDGDITGSIVTNNPVNTAAIGTYTVTYNVTDAHGNTATQVSRSVQVVDVTAPTINVTGANPMTVEIGGTYTELGAVATDDVDGTFAATPSGSVDTNTLGTYTITYNATDSSTNAAVPVTRTVNVVDTTAPILTLLGITPTDAEWTQVYTDAGATASDNVDGDITSSIIVVNPVDTLTIGNYTITYDVTDAHGNAATQITRTVNVVDTTAPVISSLSAIPTTTTAAITFSTNENATSVINYGETSAYGTTATIASTATMSHSITLTGLNACGQRYHYSVTATDTHGNITTTPDDVFIMHCGPTITTPTGSGFSPALPEPESTTSSTSSTTSGTTSGGTSSTSGSGTTGTTTTGGTTSGTTPTETGTTGGTTLPTNPTTPVNPNQPTPESNPTTPTNTETGTTAGGASTGGTTTPGGTRTGTTGQSGGNTGAAFNPRETTLDAGGGVAPEVIPTPEAIAPVTTPVDEGGGVVPEENSHTLTWVLLALLGLLNGWYFFVYKGKPEIR